MALIFSCDVCGAPWQIQGSLLDSLTEAKRLGWALRVILKSGGRALDYCGGCAPELEKKTG